MNDLIGFMDSKGRVYVGHDMGDEVVMYYPPRGCELHIYTKKRFRRVTLGLSQAPGSDPSVRDARRLVFGGSYSATVNSGRAVVPKRLRGKVSPGCEIIYHKD